MPNLENKPVLPTMKELKAGLEPFNKAKTGVAVRQLVVTLTLYVLGWVAMYYSLRIGYWLTLLLAVPTAGLLVRIFILFHDCGHNSFFPSTTLNRRVGFWLGVLVFTPGAQWWRSHAIHHASVGNLDKRGVGDVLTLTVTEYRQLPALKKIGYRIVRNPWMMFGFGPIVVFLIQNRWPFIRHGKKETLSVLWANLAILGLAIALSLSIGFKNYVLIQLPVIWMAGLAGIWLFYIQHQFENVYWARDNTWNYVASSLLGSSYYKLPPVLQWFSGSIGYHHIHHLSPRVPNYLLEAAYRSSELFQRSPTINIRQSLASARLNLFDEEVGKMVSFSQLG